MRKGISQEREEGNLFPRALPGTGLEGLDRYINDGTGEAYGYSHAYSRAAPRIHPNVIHTEDFVYGAPTFISSQTSPSPSFSTLPG